MTVTALSSSAITTEITTVETAMKKPIAALQTIQNSDTAEISAWGVISGRISSLSQALSSIQNISTLNARAVNSSNTAVATATVAASAATGNYNLTNVTLAKGQEIYSSLLGSANATLAGGAGSLVIGLNSGKSETISLGSGSLSMSKLASAINKQAGGVQASVIGTSLGARLVLTSSATGASAGFTVSGTGALSQFDYPAGSGSSPAGETLAQSASDAALTLNGIPITSASNTLASVVSGLTLTLGASGNAAVSVSSSTASLSSAVGQVTYNLNNAIAAITKETKYVAATASLASSASSTLTSGPLLGNYSATMLKNNLLAAVSGLAASGISAGAIGLSINSSGTISFNSASFAAAFSSHSTAVEKLVGNLYSTLSTISDGAIGTTSSTATLTGFISTETASLNAVIGSLQDEINQMTTLDAKQLQILQAAYTVAEAKSSSASIVQSYLSIFTGSGSSSSTKKA